MLATIPLIIFPYHGYEDKSKRQENFWDLLEVCKNTITNYPPVIAISRDTRKNKDNKNYAAAFDNDVKDKNYTLGEDVDTFEEWSVDTCQRWLSGWRHIIEKYPEVKRIALLPGDIDNIINKKEFLTNIKTLLTLQSFDIIIGDFKTSQKYSSKDLIDLFGTIPLMANWFPDITREIQNLPLQKPRSEFLNIEIEVLTSLLKEGRPFAYEQTLNMLIRAWNFKKKKWEFSIQPVPLGFLEDEKGFRTYLGCLDQIERTERMLKLVWREIHNPDTKNSNYSSVKYKDWKTFIAQYDSLDRHSTSIRDNSRITIRALLPV